METIVQLYLSVLLYLLTEQHGHTIQHEPIKSCIRLHIPVVISF